MTNLPHNKPSDVRMVLVSCGPSVVASPWLHGLDDAFRPCRLSACRTHTRDSALRMVERGGLSAAVLVDDRPRMDGLSVLRAIRSIDEALPCWLVIGHANRRILEVALELSVCGVMDPMTDVIDLSHRLARYLDDPLRRN